MTPAGLTGSSTDLRELGRVLLLGSEWPTQRPGGVNRYLAELLAGLRSGGVDAGGLVLGPAPGAPPWVDSVGTIDEPLAVRLWRMNRQAKRAGAAASVVDVHFAVYGMWPTTLGALRSRPLVVHFQGPWAEESRASGKGSPVALLAKRIIERRVYRRADRLVVLSSAFKRLLVEGYGVQPWRVSVIPPGVDPDRFSPGDPASARARLGVAPGDRLVVAVRRLERRMGLDMLLDAWAGVATRIPGALLALVGEGSERAPLESRAEELGIADRVRLVGAVGDDQLVDWYRAADLAVVPSLCLEGFGLVVLESLACGTPVLVSDAGGLPEAVAGLDGGLVVQSADAEVWEERLVDALEQPQHLPARARCVSHGATFSWERVADRHQDLYAAARRPAKRRLRVVFLDHCAELSGAELFLAELVSALDVDAHVILAGDGPLVAHLTRAGASVETLAMGEAARGLHRARVRPGRLPWRAIGGSVAYGARLTWRLRKLRPDVVHTNTLKSALYGGLAARLAGVPLVWHLHDRLVPEHLPPPAIRMMRTLARRMPAGIIANSHSSLSTVGPVMCPSAVVPGSIIEPAAWRRPTGDAKRGPLRLGMVGRLAEWKGQHVFLAAFAQAFPGGDEEAVVVGSALFHDLAYEQELADLCHHLGIGARAQFLGHSSDVASELARMDIFVHASVTPEPFGRVIVEAMAAGIPVVASAAGGPVELIEDERTGLLVPPGDVAALACALRRLAAFPDLRARLSEAGLRKATEFSGSTVTGLVTDLYSRALTATGRSAPLPDG